MLNKRRVDDLSISAKEIEKLKTDIRHLQKRLSTMKETPTGLRSWSEKLKPISCLNNSGGGYRKRVMGVKSILDQSCPDIVDVCKNLFKKSDIKEMLKQLEFYALGK